MKVYENLLKLIPEFTVWDDKYYFLGESSSTIEYQSLGFMCKCGCHFGHSTRSLNSMELSTAEG